MTSLAGKNVLVHGLGKSGVAAVRLLRQAGAKVSGVDARPASQLGATLELLQGAELFLGVAPEGLHERFDLVVVSPGVPLASPELQRAAAKGVRLIGEIELAGLFLSGPVIGITGTNGKSTTTALTGELMTRAGRSPFVGGNLGLPLSEAPLSGQRYGAYVVELSSFQLEGIRDLRVNAAALLNLTPDHLDRYPSQEAYGEAKARIFHNQREGDAAVVNADDAHVVRLVQKAPRGVTRLGFTLRPSLPAPFEHGAFAEGDGFSVRLPGRPSLHLSVTGRTLRGQHNLQNAMAASLLALWSGAPAEAVQAGLEGYPGLAHRLESVRVVEGVEWINDSKATNVESSLVALAAFPGGVWLIAGGKGKGAPYQPLVEASRSRVKGVLTVGEDAANLEAAYRGVLPVHPCGTLAGAVAKARQLATAGDVVLLSPACASYDQFKNFEDRGDQFKRLVRELQ